MINVPVRYGRVLAKAAGATAVAEVGSIALFLMAQWATGDAIDVQDWLETLLIPLIVAMPIATFVFRQDEKLRRAYEQLLEADRAAIQSNRQLHEAKEQISFAVSHDRMTGLLNRETFMALLALGYARNSDGVLLIADADRLKLINDQLGYQAGDAALVAIATAIKAVVPALTVLGRIGGEEFGVWLAGHSVSEAAEIGELIRSRVAASEWSHRAAHIPGLSVSIGGAAVRDCPEGVAELIVQAERSLAEAKRTGRNRIAFNAGVSDLVRSMKRSEPRPALARQEAN